MPMPMARGSYAGRATDTGRDGKAERFSRGASGMALRHPHAALDFLARHDRVPLPLELALDPCEVLVHGVARAVGVAAFQRLDDGCVIEHGALPHLLGVKVTLYARPEAAPPLLPQSLDDQRERA